MEEQRSRAYKIAYENSWTVFLNYASVLLGFCKVFGNVCYIVILCQCKKYLKYLKLEILFLKVHLCGTGG